jgi:hypothetical protein
VRNLCVWIIQGSRLTPIKEPLVFE